MYVLCIIFLFHSQVEVTLNIFSSLQNAKITKLLGEEPSLAFAGSNVNLTITTEALTLMVMETGEVGTL